MRTLVLLFLGETGVLGVFLLILAATIYFIPTIVAYGKRNTTAICLLNIFLGWTLVGWVVALVWAASDESPQPRVPPPSYNRPTTTPASTTTDEIIKLVNLRNNGDISEAEFQHEKQRIINTPKD